MRWSSTLWLSRRTSSRWVLPFLWRSRRWPWHMHTILLRWRHTMRSFALIILIILFFVCLFIPCMLWHSHILLLLIVILLLVVIRLIRLIILPSLILPRLHGVIRPIKVLLLRILRPVLLPHHLICL
jgi:hypothetical protein